MFKKLYYQAANKLSNEHAAREVDKVGTLRAGSTGCLVGEDVVGQCHRIALLRFLGLEEQEQKEKPNLYFDMGAANEMLWKRNLEKVLPGQFKYESDIPTVWEVDGVRVTGSPDVVLVDEQGKPLAGLELKGVGSLGVAASVIIGQEPKVSNVLQAAHYSTALGVPYYLVYTTFAGGAAPFWTKKKYGASGDLVPTIVEFAINIADNGAISYTDEAGTVHNTVLTVPGIKDFYRLVVAMSREKNLYTRFRDADLQGNSLAYDPCKRCKYVDMCDKYENDYDKFIEAAQIKKAGGQP